jgi:hypothetical protein
VRVQLIAGVALLTIGVALVALSAPPKRAMDVYKSPTCGCCAKWMAIAESHGLIAAVKDVPDVGAVKDEHQVPVNLRACHTSVAGGYVFEGHVPPDLIQQVLTQRPTILGLAVPGMPIGAPGMEDSKGRKDPFVVMAFSKDGTQTIYARR